MSRGPEAPRPRDAQPAHGGPEDGGVPEAARRSIRRDALGIGAYAAAFGASFGAVATTSGLDVWQASVLSLLLFSGASQFALVGVLGAGGSALAGVAAALLLGVRNAFYGLRLAPLLRLRGWRRMTGAQLVIDETTAMAGGRALPAEQRYAFWATGVVLFVCWNAGTVAGAVGGAALGDPRALGLDAAVPAAFLALLVPQLRTRESRLVALGGALVALALVPLAPAGVPVLAAAVVAFTAALVRPAARGPARGAAS